MALSLISLAATVLLVFGFINSRTWTLDRNTSFAPVGIIGQDQETSTSNHKKPLLSLPPSPLLYQYQYPVPLKYYLHRRRLPLLDRGPQPRTFEIAPLSEHPAFSGLDKTSDFYYILPILLVIGLGSFLIPIISTFFTAMITSGGGAGGCCGRRRRRNGDKLKPPSLSASLQRFWEVFLGAMDIHDVEEDAKG